MVFWRPGPTRPADDRELEGAQARVDNLELSGKLAARGDPRNQRRSAVVSTSSPRGCRTSSSRPGPGVPVLTLAYDPDGAVRAEGSGWRGRRRRIRPGAESLWPTGSFAPARVDGRETWSQPLARGVGAAGPRHSGLAPTARGGLAASAPRRRTRGARARTSAASRSLRVVLGAVAVAVAAALDRGRGGSSRAPAARSVEQHVARIAAQLAAEPVASGSWKPRLGASRISSGTQPRSASRRPTFFSPPRSFSSARQRGGELHQLVVEQRRAGLERVRHRRDVDLGQQVVRAGRSGRRRRASGRRARRRRARVHGVADRRARPADAPTLAANSSRVELVALQPVEASTCSARSAAGASSAQRSRRGGASGCARCRAARWRRGAPRRAREQPPQRAREAVEPAPSAAWPT